jgi:hypothetical protein
MFYRIYLNFCFAIISFILELPCGIIELYHQIEDILIDNDRIFFYINLLGQKEMNKSNRTLNRQKSKPIEQVKIILRTKYYSIQTEKGIIKGVYRPIMSSDYYFINTDKSMLDVS